MSSVKEIFPSCTNVLIANPANCLDTEAMSNTVADVLGISYSIFAKPYPFLKITFPFCTMAAASPGPVLLLYFSKIASTFVVSESVFFCAIAQMHRNRENRSRVFFIRKDITVFTFRQAKRCKGAVVPTENDELKKG